MSKTKFLILAFLAVSALSFGAIWVFQVVTGDKPYSGEWDQKRSWAEIEAAYGEHVREADAKASQAVAHRSAELSEFIRSKRSGAGPFSKDIVSWYGKWRALKPYLPVTEAEGHTEYIKEKFNEHIFTTEELAAAVSRAIEGSIRDLESIENQLAVALRQEILGRTLGPNEIPFAEEEFRKAVEQMVAASQWDAAKSAGSLVASEIAAVVAVKVFIRLGVSYAILATGAVNAWWSFGAALVIGLIVDVVWEWIDDPAGDIEREMIAALDKLSEDASKAIREEMNSIISQRSKIWTQTLYGILL